MDLTWRLSDCILLSNEYSISIERAAKLRNVLLLDGNVHGLVPSLISNPISS
jgi:hypothetical protein